MSTPIFSERSSASSTASSSGKRERWSRSFSSSWASASVCTCIEIHSPTAMLDAPATSPERPAFHRVATAPPEA